ncbi:uncharacterized protein LOC132201390 isoform X2 [Neocloeon triangulifer]|nr:uncharacterized protein LOC132201390 isoform X2 [Neocloeon triangulifer]XP_059483523.1 uncharacterized protein LOC132201390 isoform X2 [Neocloeon triangulifer]XP_059483524.1 uncharacterized protein LOC132201390 isoform X2 [Neocloeon triangulifer]XP_059483525.1 uncharacterized protein LOC132201390 isoform X2 [Neocloeon triangulifer]
MSSSNDEFLVPKNALSDYLVEIVDTVEDVSNWEHKAPKRRKLRENVGKLKDMPANAIELLAVVNLIDTCNKMPGPIKLAVEKRLKECNWIVLVPDVMIVPTSYPDDIERAIAKGSLSSLRPARIFVYSWFEGMGLSADIDNATLRKTVSKDVVERKTRGTAGEGSNMLKEKQAADWRKASSIFTVPGKALANCLHALFDFYVAKLKKQERKKLPLNRIIFTVLAFWNNIMDTGVMNLITLEQEVKKKLCSSEVVKIDKNGVGCPTNLPGEIQRVLKIGVEALEVHHLAVVFNFHKPDQKLNMKHAKFVDEVVEILCGDDFKAALGEDSDNDEEECESDEDDSENDYKK